MWAVNNVTSLIDHRRHGLHMSLYRLAAANDIFDVEFVGHIEKMKNSMPCAWKVNL